MKFTVVLATLGTVMVGGAWLNRASLSAQGAKTQWDGVYTEAQAKRAAPVYEKLCANCHGAALEGGEMAPPLAGTDFGANWDTLPLGELVERMRTTMPQENPGSLSRQQNADLLAYMLMMDKVPAGGKDLPGNADALNSIKFQAQRPEGK
jgi:cytochrome c553